MAKIRLVSYGSAPYRFRQKLLTRSARASGAVHEISEWNPARLTARGFAEHCPDISLEERGGGWWVWKPFIIDAELAEMNDGDWLLYCDIGRTYPVKMIDRPVQRLLDWCAEHGQYAMPGIYIPWFGPTRRWTKRDAFVRLECDEPPYYEAVPIQASFSLWHAGRESRAFVSEWRALCADRALVTDDPNTCGLNNLEGFREHRYDQSLLTLLSMKRNLRGLDVGDKRPEYDEKNPAEVARMLGEAPARSIAVSTVRWVGATYAWLERIPRLWTGWRYRRSLGTQQSRAL